MTQDSPPSAGLGAAWIAVTLGYCASSLGQACSVNGTAFCITSGRIERDFKIQIVMATVIMSAAAPGEEGRHRPYVQIASFKE
jgi:hypothetical protein